MRKKIEQSAFVLEDGVKLQYSPFGKMNVVKGALADLMVPHENFARHLVTYRRIDKLVTLPWEKHTFANKMWPKPAELGALPFEKENGKLWLNVIESGIPKVRAIIILLTEFGLNISASRDFQSKIKWLTSQTIRDGAHGP